jgi:predicted ATPase/DNA-binding CsgD family transcriptional regulator
MDAAPFSDSPEWVPDDEEPPAIRPAGFSPPPPPAILSSFVGRAREVEEVVGFFRRGVRLVTLTGPGGVGKTRLAIRVAEALAAEPGEQFRDGVAFVRLETLRDPGLIDLHVAQAFGVRAQSGTSPSKTLHDVLRDRRLLLVLDNFEHLLDSATFVSDLLAACPGPSVLATSRARLDLTGEHQYPVQTLGLPPRPAGETQSQVESDPAQPDVVAAVADSDSGRLFVERARARDPHFTLSPTNAVAVAAICRRLDGLPLAIELAAGHAQTLTPQAMVELLEPELSLLSGGPRDVQPRHRTLHDALDWSYDWLPPDRQAMFRRLCVFVGGFGLEAVMAVAGSVGAGSDAADALPALSAAAARPLTGGIDTEVFDSLEALADQHLIRVETSGGPEPRFGMLETTREYALRRLVESEEEDSARAAHAAFFLALADEAHFRGLRGPDQDTWLDRLDTELANFRAALAWALDRGKAAKALGLARSLQSFWARRGHQREAQQWLTRAVALAEEDSVTAEKLAALRASALLELGHNAMDLSEFDHARASYDASLQLWQLLGEEGGAATALECLGTIALRQGKYQEARTRHEAALRFWQRTANRRYMGLAHFALGEVALGEGDLERAQGHAEEALGLSQAVGDASQVGFTYWLLGLAAYKRADLVAADRFLAHAEAIFTKSRDKEGMRRVLAAQAELLFRRDHAEAARERFSLALSLCRQLGHLLGSIECVEGLALMASSLGQEALAVRLLAATTTARARLGVLRPAPKEAETARVLDAACSALGADRCRRIADEGSELTLDEAADQAAALPVAADAPVRQPVARAASPYRLTPHQAKVLQLVAEGLTDREVADRLFISRRTVTTHMEHILAALGVERRAGAVALAIREGLIAPAAPGSERNDRP